MTIGRLSIGKKNKQVGSANVPRGRHSGSLSRAIRVSLCFGILLAGIGILSYKMLKAKDQRASVNHVAKLESPSLRRGLAPSPANPNAKSDSRAQEHENGKVNRAFQATSTQRRANRIIARSRIVETASTPKRVRSEEAKPENINASQGLLLQEALTESVKRSESFQTEAFASPSSPQGIRANLDDTSPSESEPRWIPPANRRAIVTAVNDSNKAPDGELPPADQKALAVLNSETKTKGPDSSAQTPNVVKSAKEVPGEMDKPAIHEALKEADSKSSTGALETKGAEFQGAIGIKSAATSESTIAPGVTAKPNALQEPAPSLKVEISKPESVYPAEFIGDVRNLPQRISEEERLRFRPDLELEGPPIGPKTPMPGAQPKAEAPATPTPGAPMPGTIQSFNGLNFASNGAGWPPDTVGDVGPNHYVQAVNTSVGIFNKTGTQLAAFTFNSLWSGAATGTSCDTAHQGDPTVIYNATNNRWIVADFSWTNIQSGPYYECIAVSKTSDPVSGGWWLFAYRADDATHQWLPDYPKMGIWPDGLYMTANMFDCLSPTCSSASYQEVRAYAFNISDLVNGAALRSVVADTNSAGVFTLLPSNYRGTAPPAGRENLLVSESGSLFAFEVWKFHVDYSGTGSSFTGPTNVSQASYTVAATTVPSPGNPLDSLRERMMMQNQYRNIAGVESLWVNHSVGTATASTPVGIQWAQINVTGGVITTSPVQEQIYNNGADGLNRWMGALAVDNQGNMALGYSVSSASLNPDIRYAGRLFTDPLGTLPQTEVTMLTGVTRGTQSGSCGGTCIRWGDYSAMSIDPVDQCTFWYTQEYYGTTGLSWLTRIGSFKFPTCTNPTAAKVKTFTADRFDDGGVLLRWSTGYEVDNLGYNVYRDTNGQRTKINPQTIAGSALVTGPRIALTAGNSYSWGDLSAPSGARYWLEDIDLNGKSSWTGPISLNAKGGKAPSVDQSVFLARAGLASEQMTFGQGSTQVERKAEIASVTPEAIKLQTDLAGAPTVKLGVNQEGWYHISQQDLVAAGLNPKVDARNLQLYVDGREVPMIVNGEQDGRLDPRDSIEFYGVGLNSASTNTHVYWLVAGDQTGSRITTTRTVGGHGTPGSFIASVERKDRTLYFAGLRNGETENFFGPVIAGTAVDQSLTLTSLAPISAPANLEVILQGVTKTAHQTQVTLNGSVVGTVSFKDQESGKASFTIAQSQLREGVNSVQFIAQGGSSDISLVDTVRISYERTLSADNNQLRAQVKGGQPVTIAGFTSSDIRVMDVTDVNNPSELVGTISGPKFNSSITLTVPGTGSRSLLAFTGAGALSPAAKANAPSNLHEHGLQYDYVMITTGDLKPSMAPLKALRESQGLSVAVVDIEDVYDEFSFGNKSPQAIKDFLQFTRDNWSHAPRFVLFAGDSSYDPKNYLGYGDSDLVPTRLYDSAYMETASDDWFVDFQVTGVPEIAIGRLPVRTATEAAAVVTKILSYESSTGSNSALLASDLDDGHNFAAASGALRPLLPDGMAVQEVARGTIDDEAVKTQLLAAINQGKTIVNYDGHGSMNQWRGNILTRDDAANLTNSQKLAFFVMMTCLNGYFDDPVLESLAESLLKASGGASAVWASTALTEPGQQELLNQEMYRLLFSGSSITIGEAAARAKHAVTDADVRRSWILFGDPAMHLK